MVFIFFSAVKGSNHTTDHSKSSSSLPAATLRQQAILALPFNYQHSTGKVLEPTPTALGLCTAMRGPTAADVGPRTFA